MNDKTITFVWRTRARTWWNVVGIVNNFNGLCVCILCTLENTNSSSASCTDEFCIGWPLRERIVKYIEKNVAGTRNWIMRSSRIPHVESLHNISFSNQSVLWLKQSSRLCRIDNSLLTCALVCLSTRWSHYFDEIFIIKLVQSFNLVEKVSWNFALWIPTRFTLYGENVTWKNRHAVHDIASV